MSVQERRFEPYTDNGGTTLGIAGDDFCIIAADTRHSEGYSINSRYVPKAYELSNGTVLATSVYHADGRVLEKRFSQHLESYEFSHDKKMSIGAAAQALSVMLYHRRFFIYYVLPILGGIDEHGKGCVYAYDPTGSMEKRKWQCFGSGSSLIMPFLDSQIGNHHQSIQREPLTLENAKRIVRDAFTSATERDIYTGDGVEIFVITREGTTKEYLPLKRD
eukprot:jgi/Hompol1/2744/HPOL_000633-RA